MNMFPWLLGATALLLLALTMEKLQALRYRRALRHIIHVNGTRGKSSVVRLIDAALRENGVKVLSKSTGTLPMILHVDGRETQLRRHAPANIREQLELMRLAVREGAEVLVIECMAVDPQLQYAAQHQILQADIGVLTNVRLDPQDVMGDTLHNVLHSLLNTVPRHGVLYTAEEALYPAIAEKAGMEHTACHLSRPRGTAEEAALDFPENVALAAAVAGELGISYANALRGMNAVRRDPYAMELLTLPGLGPGANLSSGGRDLCPAALVPLASAGHPGAAAESPRGPAACPEHRVTAGTAAGGRQYQGAGHGTDGSAAEGGTRTCTMKWSCWALCSAWDIMN